MPNRYARKRDQNHADIKAYLEAHEVECVDCAAQGTVPDLLTLYRGGADRGFAGWVEVKVPGKRIAYTWKQIEFVSRTKWPVIFATSPEVALKFAKSFEGQITQMQKDSLALLCATTPKSHLFTANQIEEAMKI